MSGQDAVAGDPTHFEQSGTPQGTAPARRAVQLTATVLRVRCSLGCDSDHHRKPHFPKQLTEPLVSLRGSGPLPAAFGGPEQRTILGIPNGEEPWPKFRLSRLKLKETRFLSPPLVGEPLYQCSKLSWSRVRRRGHARRRAERSNRGCRRSGRISAAARRAPGAAGAAGGGRRGPSASEGQRNHERLVAGSHCARPHEGLSRRSSASSDRSCARLISAGRAPA